MKTYRTLKKSLMVAVLSMGLLMVGFSGNAGADWRHHKDSHSHFRKHSTFRHDHRDRHDRHFRFDRRFGHDFRRHHRDPRAFYSFRYGPHYYPGGTLYPKLYFGYGRHYAPHYYRPYAHGYYY